MTGNKGTDYTIEGNVATALRRLAKKCGSSRGRIIMVNVLKKVGPYSIHSFQEFNAKHQQFYNCYSLSCYSKTLVKLRKELNV